LRNLERTEKKKSLTTALRRRWEIGDGPGSMVRGEEGMHCLRNGSSLSTSKKKRNLLQCPMVKERLNFWFEGGEEFLSLLQSAKAGMEKEETASKEERGQ